MMQHRRLKSAFILLSVLSMVGLGLSLVLVGSHAFMIGGIIIALMTGPLWNIIDALLPLSKFKLLMVTPSKDWGIQQTHALFDLTLMLIPALICMVWVIAKMVAAMRFVLPHVPGFLVLFGPYGTGAFAVSMLFSAYQSYRAMKVASDPVEVAKARTDMVAWLLAGFGALCLIVPTCASLVTIAPVVVGALAIVSVLCYAAAGLIKAKQLWAEEKDPVVAIEHDKEMFLSPVPMRPQPENTKGVVWGMDLHAPQIDGKLVQARLAT